MRQTFPWEPAKSRAERGRPPGWSTAGAGAVGGEGHRLIEAWCWPLGAESRGMLLELNECIEILIAGSCHPGLAVLHQRHREGEDESPMWAWDPGSSPGVSLQSRVRAKASEDPG